jgi:hypothetical protein
VRHTISNATVPEAHSSHESYSLALVTAGQQAACTGENAVGNATHVSLRRRGRSMDARGGLEYDTLKPAVAAAFFSTPSSPNCMKQQQQQKHGVLSVAPCKVNQGRWQCLGLVRMTVLPVVDNGQGTFSTLVLSVAAWQYSLAMLLACPLQQRYERWKLTCTEWLWLIRWLVLFTQLPGSVHTVGGYFNNTVEGPP